VAFAIVIVAYWVAHSALDGFPDEWFLIANMARTLISVLVLLLQHSQNRDMLALQTKVDQLLRSAIPQEITSSAAEEREAEELQTLVLVRQAEAGILADCPALSSATSSTHSALSTSVWLRMRSCGA
jgi:low affinity Fe/Cu permease